MTTYVLAGGAWLGGWAWQPVARQLRSRGHEVHPVTFTGLGDRSHLARPEVDLDTYVTDVVNLIEFEDLHDVVLVGHSYAGIVVTGVADRIPERISLLAYLDSGPSPDGVSFLDLQPPAARELLERLIEQEGEGWRLPMPSWEELEGVMGASLEGLGPEERARMRPAAPYLVRAPVAGQPGPRAAPQAADHLQHPPGPGAGDGRRRPPLVRRAGRAGVVVPGAAHRALADVLGPRAAGVAAGPAPGGGLTALPGPRLPPLVAGLGVLLAALGLASGRWPAPPAGPGRPAAQADG
jgi:pimeloyl-ACP methyl ester carboxylesterase